MTSARIEALRLQLVELRSQEEYLLGEVATSLMQDVGRKKDVGARGARLLEIFRRQGPTPAKASRSGAF